MKLRWLLWLLLAPVVVVAVCGRRPTFGGCTFKSADNVIKLDTNEVLTFMNIAKKEGDGNALLFLTHAAREPHRSDAIRIDLRTGMQSADSVPDDGKGYVAFTLAYSRDPLFTTKTIHFAYAGARYKLYGPTRSIDGRWSIDGDERFTGMRKIMFGDRVLLEQFIDNYTPNMPVDWYVALEPDGDRVVCMCRDTDTWLGVFSRKKLR